MIDMNKEYTYRNGQKVRILCVDRPCRLYPVISMDKSGEVHTHTAEGSFTSTESTYDLVPVWEPHDKEPVWCWDDVNDLRVLRFYDAENNGVFCYHWERVPESRDMGYDHMYYNHYAKVEHIEPWMLEAQKLLED